MTLNQCNGTISRLDERSVNLCCHQCRFTVPGGGRVHGPPVSLRARYGPFSASQTVPVSTALGDAEDDTAAEEELLDLSAHLVTTEVKMPKRF